MIPLLDPSELTRPISLGYFVCTTEWFKEYVYQIVVPKKLAPSDLVRVFEAGKPIELPPWVSAGYTLSMNRTRQLKLTN